MYIAYIIHTYVCMYIHTKHRTKRPSLRLPPVLAPGVGPCGCTRLITNGAAAGRGIYRVLCVLGLDDEGLGGRKHGVIPSAVHTQHHPETQVGLVHQKEWELQHWWNWEGRGLGMFSWKFDADWLVIFRIILTILGTEHLSHACLAMLIMDICRAFQQLPSLFDPTLR